MADITWADKILGSLVTHTEVNQIKSAVNSKQDELVSNTHIKTVNSTSLLGAGNIVTPNTTYTATDFDVKDLTDSTSLRTAWSAKQNTPSEGAFANGDKTLLDSIPAKLDGKENYHGVEAIGAVTFDNATHVLSVASVTYWYQGVEFVSAVPITCDIDDTLTLTANTLYYFSFDNATGVLAVSASSWNLHTKVPVALVMWNGTAGAIMKEWHSHTRDLDWHINAHLTIGTRYLSGLAVTTPTVGTPGALSISGGTLYDEDMAITISNPQTTMRGWYLASAGVYTFADYSLPYVGTTGQPQFLNTTGHTLANVGANDFVSMWVYAGNDTERPIYIIPTHAAAAYNTVALARAETPPSLAGLNISPELKLLYKFIYRGNGAFIESVDYRQASSLPAGGTAATSASSVSFAPSGSIAAMDVQGAIEEVDGELDSLIDIKGFVTVSGTPTLGGYDFLQDTTKTWTSNQWLGYKAALVTTHGTYEVTITQNGTQGFGFSPVVGSEVSSPTVTIDDLVETGVLTVTGIGDLEGAAGNGVEIILVQGTGVGTSTDTVTWDGGLETLTVFIDSDGTGTVRPIMAGNVETLINDDGIANLLFLAAIGTAGDLVAGTYTLAGGVDGDMVDGTYYIFDFQKDQVTIASGSQALGTTEIANNACATVITITATGVATTDVIDIGYNSTPVGKTGYDPTAAALTLHAFPGANEVNILVCNTTGAAVTPAAMTVNWRVAR